MVSASPAPAPNPDTAAAEARLRAREQVFALLSHEIRTPLNGVLGMAGLLASTSLDATQRAYLTSLRDCGEHLLSLVNDVLDLAKLEAGRIELEPVPTNVERLLQGVCELLSPRAHESGVDIAWAADPDLPELLADDGRLRQILFNLAGNAVKMTAKGGVLVLAERRASTSGRLRLRFIVRDTGPGLAASAQGRIFDEFVQTEAGARAGGAGLGLAIVKRLADAFNGQVGVDSEPGEGAAFWFEADFQILGVATVVRPLQGLTLGVASRSSIVREAAVRQIEGCGGRAVAVDSPGRLRDHEVDVALVDSPAREDKGAVRAPAGAPALVLLAPEERDRLADYRAAGFTGYLVKPLRRSSLVSRVLAAMAQEAPAPALTQGDDERAAPAPAFGARVLLAEDNAVNALLAKALLTRDGCEVNRVATGEEALEALAAAPYDIVLMDVRMPGLDGLAAARALRARGDRTPIVALTANAFEDDRRACLDAGMDDFLTKPLDPTALAATLARWTRRDKAKAG